MAARTHAVTTIVPDWDGFRMRTYTGTTTDHELNGLKTAPQGGDSVDFVLKVDQKNETMSFWLNPDRSKSELDQAGASITVNMDPFVYAIVFGIQFFNSAGNSSTFKNFAFYTRGDSPFAPVPEPATYALFFGALTLGYVMLRRRSKDWPDFFNSYYILFDYFL